MHTTTNEKLILMRKSIPIITSILVFSLLISACKKDIFKPGEDDDAHPVLWQYNYGQTQTNSNVIPAMDENGNVIFSIQKYADGVQEVYVFAHDKDGNALWDKSYTSNDDVVISRVMYIDSKVIYVVRAYDPLGYFQETIYCLNSSTGSVIWQYAPDFINENIIEAMALTSNYLVVGAQWGGDYPAIDELHYFNVSSGTLEKSVDLGDDEVKNISIAGNDIFLGVRVSNSKSYYTPKLIKMNLETNDISWSFSPEYLDETKYIFQHQSIPVDGNGRTFCIIGEEYGYIVPASIYILNNDGSLANTIAVPNRDIHSFCNILIDKDNNFYTRVQGYSKHSPEGAPIWEFHSGTDVPNSSFQMGCVLADNNFVYHAEQGGILNVNTNGEIAWAKYNEANFTFPGYPLLTDEGNMIVVGNEYVTCVKGDGAKIQDAPWPRVYQNNGNTNARQ